MRALHPAGLLPLAALLLVGPAMAQPTGRPVPGAPLPRGERLIKDVRPAGPAPGMIYGRALGPTSTKVVWSGVPAAFGYQLYRSGGGSSASTLLKSVSANPNLVLVGLKSGRVPSPKDVPIRWATGVNDIVVPTMSFVDTGRRPKSTYTYAVATIYPDTGAYRNGTSELAVVTMPPGLPPAWLTATTLAGTTVTLNWQAAPDATGYKVYRDDAPITAQPVRGTSFTDPGLKPGLYTYSVISYFVAEGVGEIEGELTPRTSIQVILSRCSSP